MPQATNRKRTAVAKPVTDPWMTVKQAAKALDIAPQTVYARASRGMLVTQVVAGRTFVHRASVVEMQAALAAA